MKIRITNDLFPGRTPQENSQTARLALATLVLLLLAAGCASNSTEPPQPLPAKVVRLKGNARWRIGTDGQWRPVKVGQQLVPLTVIETGPDSRVDFSIDDSTSSNEVRPKVIASALDRNGSRETSPRPTKPNEWSWPYTQLPEGLATIRIWDNTRLMICELKASPNWRKCEIDNVEFDLQAGHILECVKKLPATARFEVKTPLGIARIQGGTYDINVDGIIKVLDGSVSLDYKDAKGSNTTQIIQSQQMFDAKTGVLTDLPQADTIGMPTVGS